MTAGTRCRISLRPGHVRLASHNGSAVALPGTAELMELSGPETYSHVRAHTASQSSTIGLVAQLLDVHELELGAALGVFVDPAELFLFGDTGKLVSVSKQGGAHSTY